MNISERLKGKKALVTAAGQGIGRASAIALAKAGAEVIATDINEETLNKLNSVNIPNLITDKLDVTNERAISACVKKFAPINVLFNCAGFVHSGSILEGDNTKWNDEWNVAINLNIKSMSLIIRGFLESMIENGGGSIINMSSVASSIKAVPNRFLYSMSKAAVIGITKSIAADFINKGIRCNAICPGTVESPSVYQRISSQAKKENKSVDDVMNVFKSRQPMGRLGKDSEIAALVVYLASDESGFTTGTIHVIDGGWTA